MSKIVDYLFVVAIITLLSACDSESKFNNIEQAIKRNKYDVTEIIVRPTQTITVGNEQGGGTTYLSFDFSEKFKATGITSSGKEVDISSEISWSSSNSNIAEVNQSGVVTTFGNSGSVSIIAKLASIQGQAIVQVSAEPLSVLEIARDGQVLSTPYDVGVCAPIQFTALGTYGVSEPKRYVTHLVTWEVTHTNPNDSAVTLDPISRVFNQQGKKGRFGAWGTTASVKAELNISLSAIQSSPLELNIQGSISEINISPNGAIIPISSKQQFTANGKYNATDTSTADMSDAAFWSPPQSGAITVSDTGLVTGVSPGSSTLTVSCAGVEDSVTVTVSEAAKIERISIDYPEDFVEMTQNETVQLKAVAHYSDGRTPEDITESDNTSWSVRIIDKDKAQPIAVSNDTDPVDKGNVTYKNNGDTIPVGEKRFSEVVVKYNNDLVDDIVVVVIP